MSNSLGQMTKEALLKALSAIEVAYVNQAEVLKETIKFVAAQNDRINALAADVRTITEILVEQKPAVEALTLLRTNREGYQSDV